MPSAQTQSFSGWLKKPQGHRSVALGTTPESGSAQTLLYLLTGQWEQAPIELPERIQYRKNSQPEIKNQQIFVFPNPVQNELLITNNFTLDDNYTLYLYDLYGKLLFEDLVNNGKNTYNVSFLSGGSYFLIVRDDSGYAILEEKVLIQR